VTSVTETVLRASAKTDNTE